MCRGNPSWSQLSSGVKWSLAQAEDYWELTMKFAGDVDCPETDVDIGFTPGTVNLSLESNYTVVVPVPLKAQPVVRPRAHFREKGQELVARWRIGGWPERSSETLAQEFERGDVVKTIDVVKTTRSTTIPKGSRGRIVKINQDGIAEAKVDFDGKIGDWWVQLDYLEQLRKQDLLANDIVEVIETFVRAQYEDVEGAEKCCKGTIGKIVEVDKDGHALVEFEQLGNQWVFNKDFVKLKKIGETAGTEDTGIVTWGRCSQSRQRMVRHNAYSFIIFDMRATVIWLPETHKEDTRRQKWGPLSLASSRDRERKTEYLKRCVPEDKWAEWLELNEE